MTFQLPGSPQFFNGTYGVGQTFGFSLTDGASLVFVTGFTFGAGNSLISKDYGAFINTTNSPSEIATASGIYKLALTAAEMAAKDIIVKLTHSGTFVDQLFYVYTTDRSQQAQQVVQMGTAQAGSTSSTLVLSTTADNTDDQIYTGDTILIFGGTGAGQYAGISNYASSTQTATINGTWIITPDNTSVYAILPGTSTTVTATGVWTALEGAQPTGPIPSNASFGQILQYWKREAFNNVTQTVTTRTVFEDDGITPLTTMNVSYDGITQTKGPST